MTTSLKPGDPVTINGSIVGHVGRVLLTSVGIEVTVRIAIPEDRVPLSITMPVGQACAHCDGQVIPDNSGSFIHTDGYYSCPGRNGDYVAHPKES